MLVKDFSAKLNKVNGYMYVLSKSGYADDKTNLCKQIDILHQAIENRDEISVDHQMTVIDTEFEKIALATNPNIASDRVKFDQDITEKAKAMTAAKAAVDAAKTPEDRLNALLREYELMNPSVDKDAVNCQVEDLEATKKL